MRKETKRRGIAAVEFALVSPFLCLIIVGTIEVGRVVQVQCALTNAVREGCRGYADSTVTLTSGSQTGTSSYAQSVVLGALGKANLNINTANVTVTTSSTQVTVSGIAMTQVTVTASIPASKIAIFPPFFVTRDLKATATMYKSS
jgi:Flp pilus assembly protein TadG